MNVLCRIWRSSVGKKAIAALTGLVLFGWLVAHIAGNLLVFSGPELTDGYAASLRKAPLLLWTVRALTAAALALHVAAIVSLTRRARAAQGDRGRARTRAATLASRTMRAGGAALVVFLIVHLLHLTFGVLHPAFDAGRVHANVVIGLSSPLVALGYVFAALLVGLHLLHGFWAAARSLGLRLHASSRRRPLVSLIALSVALGFASVPIGVLLGALR